MKNIFLKFSEIDDIDSSLFIAENSIIMKLLTENYIKETHRCNKITLAGLNSITFNNWVKEFFLDYIAMHSDSNFYILNKIQKFHIWNDIILNKNNKNHVINNYQKITETIKNQHDFYKLFGSKKNKEIININYVDFFKNYKKYDVFCKRNKFFNSYEFINYAIKYFLSKGALKYIYKKIYFVGQFNLNDALFSKLISSIQRVKCKVIFKYIFIDEDCNTKNAISKNIKITYKNKNDEIINMLLWANDIYKKGMNAICIVPDITEVKEMVEKISFMGNFYKNRQININDFVFEQKNTFFKNKEIYFYFLMLKFVVIGINLEEVKFIFNYLYNFNYIDTYLDKLIDISIINGSILPSEFKFYNLNKPDNEIVSLIKDLIKKEKYCCSLRISIWIDYFRSIIADINKGIFKNTCTDNNMFYQFNRLLDEIYSTDIIINNVCGDVFIEIIEFHLKNNTYKETTSKNNSINNKILIIDKRDSLGIYSKNVWIMGLDDLYLTERYCNKYLSDYKKILEKTLNFNKTCNNLYSSKYDKKFIKNKIIINKKFAEFFVITYSSTRDNMLMPPSSIVNSLIVNKNEYNNWQYLVDAHRYFYKNSDKENTECKKKNAYLHINKLIKDKIKSTNISSYFFNDYNKCPFIVFAKLILEINTDIVSVDNNLRVNRGILIHKILEVLWGHIKSNNNLIKKNNLKKKINYFIDREVINYYKKNGQFNSIDCNFIDIERICIKKIIAEYLKYEEYRYQFNTVLIEGNKSAIIGGKKIRYRIDRIDKIDNNFYIIDYKTGQNYKNKISFNEKVYDYQLPFYVVAEEKNNIGGIIIINISYNNIYLSGIVNNFSVFESKSKSKNIQNFIKEINFNDWNNLIKLWKSIIVNTIENFESGRFNRLEKFDKNVCNFCKFKFLCRVFDKK